jgi:hypothetical protein
MPHTENDDDLSDHASTEEEQELSRIYRDLLSRKTQLDTLRSQQDILQEVTLFFLGLPVLYSLVRAALHEQALPTLPLHITVIPLAAVAAMSGALIRVRAHHITITEQQYGALAEKYGEQLKRRGYIF